MRERLIKVAVWLFMVVLFSAGTIFVSRGTRSPEGISLHAQIPAEEVSDPPYLSPPIRDFITFMEQELDSSGTVGAAYTIVQGGAIVHTGTYGLLEQGRSAEVDEHTLFRLASVSKGFAGVLAGLLEEEGIFSLDDRVVEHYAGFALKDSLNTADLTIRHLLSHSSGLVPYAFDNLVEADQDLYSIIDRLDEVNISAPPGELYGYQNVLFSMLDPIAKKATGTPYQVLLEQKIFEPLGMHDASAGPIDLKNFPNLALPHVNTGRDYVALDSHNGYYNVLPAAGVNASISDMGQWLLALLGHKGEVLSDTVLRKISTPVIYTPLKWRYTRYWRPFRERHYSLGWRIYTYQGRQIVYHGGYIRGYRAEIAFCPSEDVGIAFMQNSPNSLASRFVPTFMDLFLE
jgi:beta-lactamase class C